MVFSNPRYPYLTRTLKRARERERNVARKRRKTMAAVTIQRAVRARNAYTRRALAATGESTISYPAEGSAVVSDGWITYPSNELQVVNPLSVLRSGTTNMDLNTRQKDVIYLAGFKLHCSVRNNLAVAEGNEIYFNVALLSNKPGNSAVSELDLFSSFKGTTRAFNFTNENYSAYERHTAPINSDNYVCHWHERFLIGPATTSSSFAGIASAGSAINKTFELSKYVPIKRQIRFDSLSGTSSEPKFALIFWAGIPGEVTSAPSPLVKTSNVFKMEHSIVAYYRDP